MRVKQPYWSCWLGICLWLLAGEGGCAYAKNCRIPPCGRNTNGGLQSSRQQCHGAHCFSRSNRSSHTFVQPSSKKQPQQSSIGSILGLLGVAGRGTEAICSGGRDCTRRTLNSTMLDCRGIECRLPLHIRQKPRPASQIFPCPPNQGEGCLEPNPIRVTEKAAQFIGEELAYTASEFGGAALGVQLTCDVKPGDNEVPSEDALVLQLQLTKGQEKFVETLKSQQAVIVDLQQKLTEQQNALVTQQREIIMQQRKMYEQMDLIKVQYGMLFDTVKQMSFKGLQEDIQHYFEANLQSLQKEVRNHLQKSYSGHKLNADAKMIDIGETLMECSFCESDEFCNFQKTPSQCEKCTLCPAGFFQLLECSTNTDRICQDRDECFESPRGFRCLGMAEKEASLGLCGEEYFFNKEQQECQACLVCDDGAVVLPCSLVSDTVCSTAVDTVLSETWAAETALPLSGSSKIYPGFNLKLKEKHGCDMGNLDEDSLVFKDHGLMWADFNFAVKHNCRNFLHLSFKFKDSEEGYELSGVRIEQPEGKLFQGASVSSAAEVEPSQTLSVFLKSPNQFCNQSKDLDMYNLQTPLSLFWLSHDTGAVAMTAQIMTAVHYQTNYQPTFKFVSLSDSYMVTLSHDGRAIKFTEMGVVKFVFQQALYSMGHTCIHEGFNVVVYLNKNGTNAELMTVYKSGVNYRDTSISVSGATKVSAGDLMSFEILSPAQCSVRYFGDSSGISTLSLIWLPSAVSTALSARVSVIRLPTGAVRNKVLDFADVSTYEKQIYLISTGQFAQKYFMFTERGIASIVFTLKLIHSCNMLRVTLNQCIGDNAPLNIIAQQIGGQVPEGSIWTSVSLRSSFKVHNGTMVSVSLDCVRGRINHIAHEYGTNLSILWISS
ncbi:putative leucine-rich repeat-containing protein, partial [Ophiophagus hannah]